MDVKETFAGLPWWVKWVAIPGAVLVLFGGLVVKAVAAAVGLLLKLLVLAALVGGAVHVVRKLTSSGSSGSS